MKHYLVTGGTGFIGAAVVKKLVDAGHKVRILDDNSRGRTHRIADVLNKTEMIEGDVRKASDVSRACEGVDGVIHLAFVNGTEYFYTKPELVLDVGVKGMVNVLDACVAQGIKELVLASSSEVYQVPPRVPTDENVPLCIPDPLNPRYSYAAGKMISEIMAINYGRKFFDRVLIFRPHNVFGPDMGWEHVVPQFALRMARLAKASGGPLKFPIQGSGTETRSFIYIDDFADGFMRILEKGEHLGIYHIGTEEEVSIRELALMVAASAGREIELVPGPLQVGGTPRRCPDIGKLSALGFKPQLKLKESLPLAVKWYLEHEAQAPTQEKKNEARP